MAATDREETKPVWTSSSFLIYTGGLTVLGGAFGALAYLMTQYRGNGQGTAWALLILVILYAIAHALKTRDRWLAAGIFAFSSVLAWAFLVGQFFTWIGATGINAPLHLWSWERQVALLLVLVVAWDDRRRFRFPFIAAISAVVLYLFVLSVLPDGRHLTYIWTLLLGLAYLVIGSISDKPGAFWLHFVGAPLVAVPIVYWCHTSDFQFAVLSFMSLVFLVWAHWTRRSIWAVYGTLGFFAVTIHFLVGSPTGIAANAIGGQAPNISVWSYPLGFGLLGFWLVLLGILGKHHRHKHAHHPASAAPAAPPAA